MPILYERLTILVIEDNPADVFLIEEMLRSSRLTINQIYTASNIAEATAVLRTKSIDFLFLDLSLPDSFGIETLLDIKAQTTNIPVVILSGSSESAVALEALKHGAQDYLVKGDFTTNLLAKTVQYSLERKKAEKKILESEEKYRQMFNQNPFPTCIYDVASGRILDVNEAAINKYGYGKEEFLRLSVKSLLVRKDAGDWENYTNGKMTKEKLLAKYQLHKKKNGSLLIAEVITYQINYFGKIAMQAQVNDVTEKLSLERELLAQKALKQRQLTEAILTAQEEERKTIGAELHDNINQILATSKLYYDAALENPGTFTEMIANGNKYVTMAIEEIRKLSKELVIPPFIASGLKPAIEDLAGNIMAAKNISIKTALHYFDENELSKEIKIAIYRIIQEQLNNILKYANAPAVVIDVHTTASGIVLQISDNGIGYDPRSASKGIGTTNIQTRAELFNGSIEIVSSPGNGCKLKVELKTISKKRLRAA